MCNKNSTPPPTPNMKKTKKKIQQQAKDSSSSSSSSSSSLKPHRRRNRTKKRKPKYLSLRLQLSQNQSNQSNKATQRSQPNNKAQLNLFPHQPESPVVVEEEDDKDIPEENNVALLFSSDGGATLNGLLEDESTTVTAATSDDGSLSVLTCHEGLVRKAMRRRTRSEEGSEERWVCYSEVVEKKELTEEVTSSTAAATTSFGSLSLKLDHEGILSAWSDKGSLYVAGEEAPQTVPDLLNNALLPNVAWDGYGCDVVGNTWKVPEDCTGANRVKGKEEMGWKLGQREASVLRYKEKRQNRLFSKRIRYEVRKLNAEKRPRMKGRFVKRE